MPLFQRRWMDSQNNPMMASLAQAQGQGCQLITLSHFLPHQQLMPEKRFLAYPNLVCHLGLLVIWV